MFVKFRSFAPSLLQYDPDLAIFEDPLERLQHLVRHCPLKAVRRRVNRARQRDIFGRDMVNQPAAVQAVLHAQLAGHHRHLSCHGPRLRTIVLQVPRL